MPDTKQWVVTLSPEEPLASVRHELEAAGFSVHEVHETIGVVTGKADEAGAARVRGMKGVADVSPDRPIDIGGPDSPTTW